MPDTVGMKRLKAWAPSLAALAFPLSWADASASLKSAPEVLFWGCLCVFGYLNHLAVPKPDVAKYSSRGFDVRFLPRTGRFPDDAAEKRLAALATPAAAPRPAARTAPRAADEVPFYDQGAAAPAAAARTRLTAAAQPGDASPAYSMAGFGAPAAGKMLAAGMAAMAASRAAPATIVAASEAEAERAAPRLAETQKRAAGETPGFMRLLWPATVRVLLNSKTFNDALYSNAFAKQACANPDFLAAYLSDAKDPEGVTRDVAHLAALLAEPDAAKAAAKTEFAQRAVECPAVRALARDRRAVTALAAANPALAELARDPAAAAILRSDDKASPLYDAVLQALPSPKRP